MMAFCACIRFSAWRRAGRESRTVVERAIAHTAEEPLLLIGGEAGLALERERLKERKKRPPVQYLLEDHRRGRLDHAVRRLLAALGGQAVQEDRGLAGRGQQSVVDLARACVCCV